MRRTDRYRYPIIMTLLILLQFTVRSRLGGDRIAPDFLLLALLIYTIRAEPGRSAAVGFFVGLLRDALTPASFGAGALAHTLVGFFSSRAKAVFFAEHVFVKGCLFFRAPGSAISLCSWFRAGCRARRSRGSCWSGRLCRG